MDKHTKGPWHWVNSETDEPFDFNAEWDGYGMPSLRTVAERKRIDSSYGMLPDWILNAEPMQHGNDAANARLIAAAPELLEALNRIAGFTVSQFMGPNDMALECVNVARAAIAKATGGVLG